MVKIEAIVEAFRLSVIKDALLTIGVQGLTVMGVQGFERQRDSPSLSKFSVAY